jgi:Tol biopolymer transport system component
LGKIKETVKSQLTLLSLLVFGSARAQIAFVKGNSLYVLPVGKSGLPKSGTRAIRVCSLNGIDDGTISLDCTRSGQILLGGEANENYFIWQVGPTHGARLQREGSGKWPSSSPDGKKLVFVQDLVEQNASAYVLDLETKRLTCVAKDVVGPAFWSPKGGAFTYAQSGQEPDEGDRIILESFPGKRSRRLTDGYALSEIVGFSPDGKTVSYSSGTPDGGEIIFVDVASGTKKAISTRINSAANRHDYATNFLDWTPDSRHVLLDLNMTDENGGRWYWRAVAVGNLATGHSISLPNSKSLVSPKFSADGSHIVSLERRSGKRGFDLVVIDLRKPNAKIRLASGLSEFAVRVR